MAEPSPVALLIGCPTMRRAFKAEGLAHRDFRSWKSALESGLTEDVRVIAIHQRALREEQLESRVRTLRQRAPFTDVLIWAPGASASYVRRALRSNARDIILDERPAELARLLAEIIRQQRILPRLLKLEQARSRRASFEGMHSRSQIMWDLFEQCAQVAPTEAPVLILGETGTGKELLARAIHHLSKREGRFVALDCGAIPENLLEAQLFGHVKGSFTGAVRDKPGLFQNAQRGTLFLDEIGNIPMSAQVSLLRAIQEGAVRPVGASHEQPIDARIISATNEPLESAVEDDRFREDLFFRLDVIRLIVPPLRQRPEDVLHLLEHFLKKFHAKGVNKVQLSESFLDEVLAYSWPGNVRELENFAHRLALLYPGKRVTAQQFRRLTRSYGKGSKARAESVKTAPRTPPRAAQDTLRLDIDLARSLADHIEPLVAQAEHRYLAACLAANKGRVGKTAQQAGIHRRTLLRKLKEHGLAWKEFR